MFQAISVFVTLHIVIFFWGGILSSRGMEHKKHWKANSKFRHYEKEARSSSAYTLSTGDEEGELHPKHNS